LSWIGVGLVTMVKWWFGAIAVATVLRASVARSAIRLWKLCTGSPSAVRQVVCLVTAASDRCALATGLERSASAASLSVSS